MKDEMEKNRTGDPQDTVDARKGASLDEGRGEDEGGRDSAEPLEPLDPSNPLEPLDERTLRECRRTCRRHFWTELLKTVAKVAGVVLAAFGLSSFDQES